VLPFGSQLGYDQCLGESQRTRTGVVLTIIIAQQNVKDELQAEITQEIPTDARHPSGIHFLGRNTSLQHALELDSDGERQLQNHESAEEGIDPAHDQGVGNDHGHVVFHHTHHAVHGAWVRHGVRSWLPAALGVLQIHPGLVGLNELIAPSLEGGRCQDMVIRPDCNAVRQRSLFPHGRLFKLLGRRGHEHCCIMPENASQNHDNRDGEQDPIA
jgi:hypothetical protein